jgi:hypothetical protein
MKTMSADRITPEASGNRTTQSRSPRAFSPALLGLLLAIGCGNPAPEAHDASADLDAGPNLDVRPDHEAVDQKAPNQVVDANPCSPDAPVGEAMLNAVGEHGMDGPLPQLWRECGDGLKFGVTAAEFCERIQYLCIGGYGQTTACLALYNSRSEKRQACMAFYACRAGLPPPSGRPWDYQRRSCCPNNFDSATDPCAGL